MDPLKKNFTFCHAVLSPIPPARTDQLPPSSANALGPTKKQEISLLAQKEGGYTLTGIEVLPYGHAPGSQSTVSAVFFRANEWRRLPRPVLPTPRYRSLILAGAQEQQLDES